ncbi:DNA-binding NarL/FixJ family response regulator [Bradyrhizobium sp. AZCC 1588]
MNSLSDGPKAEAITVVLVEDDAPTLWRLQDALAKAGYQVRAAGTLAEARACLAQGAPKVLLTDLQLPDGHGVDLIRETRRRFPDTEIMVISILGDEESVISAITVGATGLSAQGRIPDRHRRHRARPRRRPFADLGLDRAFHRAANPEHARAAARPSTQHRQTDAARNRHSLGHRQGL